MEVTRDGKGLTLGILTVGKEDCLGVVVLVDAGWWCWGLWMMWWLIGGRRGELEDSSRIFRQEEVQAGWISHVPDRGLRRAFCNFMEWTQQETCAVKKERRSPFPASLAIPPVPLSVLGFTGMIPDRPSLF